MKEMRDDGHFGCYYVECIGCVVCSLTLAHFCFL